MTMKIALLLVAFGLSSPAIGQLKLYSFTTTAEFVSQCGVASPPSDCIAAVQHVEEVVNSRETPNETCDGGPDAMLESSRNSAEMEAWLGERVRRIVPWLKAHHDYNAKSYGDGVWAALKGVYCA